MKVNFQMIRQHYIKILTVIFITILLIFCVSQYKTREMYKAHISEDLKMDFQQLVTSIQENDTLYNDILHTGMISKKQVNSLMWNNERMRDIILKNKNLAVELNMRKEGFQYDKSSLNAIQISRLFYDWDEAYKNKLDIKSEHMINKVQEINSKWNTAIKTQSDRYSL